jgi:hypothetical protein
MSVLYVAAMRSIKPSVHRVSFRVVARASGITDDAPADSRAEVAGLHGGTPWANDD